MGCCRSRSGARPAPSYDVSTCSSCGLELKGQFQAAAANQTAGRLGTATLLVTLACPKCKAPNTFKVNVDRKIVRP